jgi:SAM-dependent methyltransferase
MPTLFAEPRLINSLEECTFYHTMDLPRSGTQHGMWDLRPNVRKYLGNVDLRGKHVLELGTASGYLCFHMESQGAEVTAFDLAPDEVSDIVPYARADISKSVTDELWLEKVRNAFWFAHRELNSSSKVVYGNIYNIPNELGMVDVSTFGTILLHLRDPFLALQNALKLTRETVIITEPIWHWYNLLLFLTPRKKFGGYLIFVPDHELCEPPTTWWYLSPTALRRFISVLGFEKSKVTYHYQRQPEAGRKVLCFTVVGTRTVPIAEV